MSFLPEKLHSYTPILGTAKERNISTFQDLYGPILSANPETLNGEFAPEPRSTDPSVPARFKTRRILEGFSVPEGEKKVALGADVVFVNGQRHLKSERLGDDLAVEIEETVKWYCADSFIVHWLIAFAVESEDGLKRVAVLDVEGQFLEPLQELDVRQAFNPNINARFPLVESGADGRANFTISNSYRDERLPITQELAELLVVDRVLPHALMESLIEDNGEEIEGWEFIVLNLLSLTDSSHDEPVLQTRFGRWRQLGMSALSYIKNKATAALDQIKKYFNLPNLRSRL